MESLESALTDLLDATRLASRSMGLAGTFAWIAEQYRARRLPGTDLDHDGDLLRYEWGVVDWGDGLFATIDLTRQVQVAAPSPSGDPSVWQVGCRFRFPPPLLNQIKNGTCWCLHPRDSDRFLCGIRESPPWLRLHAAEPSGTVVRLNRV